jgi:hypothetical protein
VDQHNGDVGANEPNTLNGELGVAALVNGVENLPVGHLNGDTSVKLSAVNVNEGGIVRERRGETHAVARIPGSFKLSHYFANRRLVFAQGFPPSDWLIHFFSCHIVQQALSNEVTSAGPMGSGSIRRSVPGDAEDVPRSLA